MNKSPSFQFYPADWMSGAPGRMEPDETHAYVWLLCLDWEDNGFVENPKELARWCRLSLGRFNRAWVRVRQSFVERGGRLYNPRLDKERAKQAEWREKSAKGGHASVERRRKGGSRVVEPPFQPMGQPNANTSVFSFQSSDSGTSATTTGRSMLLEAVGRLAPTKSQGLAARLAQWEQGYGLPAGVGVPTGKQLDDVCMDVMASCELAQITPRAMLKFLMREMRGDDVKSNGRAVSLTEALLQGPGEPL